MRAPKELLLELEQTSRDGLEPADDDRLNAALLASREALDSATTPDGSYDWSGRPIVDAVNTVCGTSLDAFEVASRTQT
jgi:hypothetical protein